MKIQWSPTLKMLFVIRAIRSMSLLAPVLMVFYQQNGLSIAEGLLIQSLFSLVVILLDVPTGRFADLYGRKRSIIIGWITVSIGFAVYALEDGFFGFLLAEIILGIGISFMSGADVAMLFDALAEQKREDQYQKVEGKFHSVGLITQASASVVGGLLAVINLRLPLFAEAVLTAVLIPLLFFLHEPPRKQCPMRESMIRSMMKLVKFSLYDHQEIKWLMILSSSVGTSTMVLVWLIQPFFQQVGLPLAMFGVVMAGMQMLAAFFAWHAHQMEDHFGRMGSMVVLVILPAVGFWVLGGVGTFWSLAALGLFFFVRGVNSPFMNNYLNGMVSADVRATILSVSSSMWKLLYAVIGPLLGWIADAYSLQVAFLVAGVIFFGIGIIALPQLQKSRKT